MGLLSLGTPLPWNEAKEFADHVRKHGIEQFLNIYHSQKDRQKQRLLWGDEVSEDYIDMIIKIVIQGNRLFHRSNILLSSLMTKRRKQGFLFALSIFLRF